jgi:hypothetical protein
MTEKQGPFHNDSSDLQICFNIYDRRGCSHSFVIVFRAGGILVECLRNQRLL